MSKKLNFIVPINSLGYGIHSLGYVRIANDAGFDTKTDPINREHQDIRAFCTLEERQSMLLKGTDLYSDANNIVMWHIEHANNSEILSRITNDKKKILIPAFETTKLRVPPDVVNIYDYVVGLSNFAVEVLSEYFPKDRIIKMHGPCRMAQGVQPQPFKRNALAVKESDFIILSVGKFEKRKGQIEVLDFLSKLHTKEAKDLVLMTLWENPFDVSNRYGKILSDLDFILEPYSTMEHSLLQYFVYRNVNNGIRVIRLKPIENYWLIPGLYAMADAYINNAYGEGWDLPTVDAIHFGLPILSTLNTAHLEYSEHFTVGLNCTPEIAHDGIWFHGNVGNWFKPEKIIYDDILKLKAAKKVFPNDKSAVLHKGIAKQLEHISEL